MHYLTYYDNQSTILKTREWPNPNPHIMVSLVELPTAKPIVPLWPNVMTESQNRDSLTVQCTFIIVNLFPKGEMSHFNYYYS